MPLLPGICRPTSCVPSAHLPDFKWLVFMGRGCAGSGHCRLQAHSSPAHSPAKSQTQVCANAKCCFLVTSGSEGALVRHQLHSAHLRRPVQRLEGSAVLSHVRA